MREEKWKGFSWTTLGSFGVRRKGDLAIVPYMTRAGDVWREKCFPLSREPRKGRKPPPKSWWVGERKNQIPYGMETLRFGGNRVFLTEGESDSWTLRACNGRLPVLGLPGASSWQEEWALELQEFEAIYAIFDGDTAGAALYDAVAMTIPRLRIIRPIWGLDTRELIFTYGARFFGHMVKVADRAYSARIKEDPLAATKHLLVN